MTINPKWNLSDETKDALIDALTPELTTLRTKADISQGELANIIGVSRQTYGAIERQTRRMTWNTYLSLIMFYDYNQKTHRMIRALKAYPHEIIQQFNDGTDAENEILGAALDENMRQLLDVLDEQALNSIRTMIMLEYARCTDTPGEVIVKSFDGKSFIPNRATNSDAYKSLKAIKESRKHHDE